MTIDEIIPSFLSYADEFTQLGDKNLDICFMLAGYPASAATQTVATHKIKFIDLEEDRFVNLIRDYPYYTQIVIPKEVYKLEKDALAIGVPNVLIVNNDLDEELVYETEGNGRKMIGAERLVTALTIYFGKVLTETYGDPHERT